MASQQDGTRQSTCLRAHKLKQQGTLDEFTLYIPKDAEVCTVPVEMLPLSILKRMNQFPKVGKRNGMYEGDGTQTATWISPVVVRERSSPQGCDDSGRAKARLSKAAMELASRHCHCWLPITCSHLLAFKVLKQFLPSGKVQQDNLEKEMLKACQVPPVIQGSTFGFTQDSIIIHNGQIFLSIKNPQQASHSGSWRRSRGSCVATPSTSSTIQKDYPVGSRDLSEMQRRFGITQHVNVILKRIPSTDWEKCDGEALMHPLHWSDVSYQHHYQDWDSQTSSSGGRGEERRSGNAKIENSSESESLKGRKHHLFVNRDKPLAMEPEEEEPAVKSLKLTLSQEVFTKDDSCHDPVDAGAGECVVDVSESGHQNRDGDSNGDQVASECAVEGGTEWTTPQDKASVNTHEDGNQVEDAAEMEDQSPAVSTYLCTSAVEDTMVFEQLAREERISRIRERLREKEAAVRRMDSLG